MAGLSIKRAVAKSVGDYLAYLRTSPNPSYVGVKYKDPYSKYSVCTLTGKSLVNEGNLVSIGYNANEFIKANQSYFDYNIYRDEKYRKSFSGVGTLSHYGNFYNLIDPKVLNLVGTSNITLSEKNSAYLMSVMTSSSALSLKNSYYNGSTDYRIFYSPDSTKGYIISFNKGSYSSSTYYSQVNAELKTYYASKSASQSATNLTSSRPNVSLTTYDYKGSYGSYTSPTSKTGTSHNFNCWIAVYTGGNLKGARNLPIYPNEFSDNNSASFSSTNIFGRSVDYQNYSGSARSFSVTLVLHEELCNDYNEIHELVSFIESACYPNYTNGAVYPPEVLLSIGDHIKIRGILTGTDASWVAPIIDGKLVNCNLGLSITETTGPYSQSEVTGFSGRRG